MADERLTGGPGAVPAPGTSRRLARGAFHTRGSRRDEHLDAVHERRREVQRREIGAARRTSCTMRSPSATRAPSRRRYSPGRRTAPTTWTTRAARAGGCAMGSSGATASGSRGGAAARDAARRARAGRARRPTPTNAVERERVKGTTDREDEGVTRGSRTRPRVRNSGDAPTERILPGLDYEVDELARDDDRRASARRRRGVPARVPTPRKRDAARPLPGRARRAVDRGSARSPGRRPRPCRPRAAPGRPPATATPTAARARAAPTAPRRRAARTAGSARRRSRPRTASPGRPARFESSFTSSMTAAIAVLNA